jgi:hypothetical protein
VIPRLYAPRLVFAGFPALDHGEKMAVMVALSEPLILANRILLRNDPRLPSLYASGVVYQAEHIDPPTCEAAERACFFTDDWLDLVRAIQRGSADCEDLVCWRVAELREREHEAGAAPLVRHYEAGGTSYFHFLVRRADGSIEDPSRALGMR